MCVFLNFITKILRQSILAKAFSGELVETEAEIARSEGREYETAKVLLERIIAEKKVNSREKDKQEKIRVLLLKFSLFLFCIKEKAGCLAAGESIGTQNQKYSIPDMNKKNT